MICRVEMTTRGAVSVLIFVSALLAAIDGFDLRAKLAASIPTFEDCANPPLKKLGSECCRLPKERIWGDLRGSLNMCLKKLKQDLKQGAQLLRQEIKDGEPEMVTSEGSDVVLPTGDPSEAASTPMDTLPSTTARHPNRSRRPHWRLPLSEGAKDLFASVHKEIKNTLDALWQSVIIITDQRRQRSNDSCFMECVFEDQGFLLNKVLDKEALLTRLRLTLGRNEPWHGAAVVALEKCYMGLEAPPANGPCQSGSEEIFRCIFKELFFNCPNWLQSDYCRSLKEFYQKCPNGPPPETTDTHTEAPPEEDLESSITTESERYTQQ